MRNLRENRMISLTVDIRDPVNPFNNEGVLVQGKAEISRLELAEEERHPELKQSRKTFRWKYASIWDCHRRTRGDLELRLPFCVLRSSSRPDQKRSMTTRLYT